MNHILLGLLVTGQLQIDAPVVRSTQHVMFVAEPQSVAANKRSVLELRFRVDNGFHVNSHLPKSELQIPTSLDLGAVQGVKAAAAEYPAGKVFVLAADPNEKLDVYSDDFVVKVPVVAAAGQHEVKGLLTYQACDKAACYPPKTLAVDVVFEAR